MLRAGQLNQRITLENLTTGRDEYGGTEDTWGNSKTVWAAVKYQTAREAFQADQLSALQVVAFTIRYRPGVSAAKTRVNHNGQTYNITGVSVIGNNEGLLLIGQAENNG